MGIEIRHDEESERFVAVVDGAEAVVQYGRPDEQTIDLFRTYTPEALRGRGIAGHVVEAALEYAQAQGLRVLPTCPYVSRFVEKHPEYRALLTD